MSEVETEELVRLLKIRRKDIKSDLDRNDYREVTVVSKLDQLYNIDLLLIQME